jgi:hypothetical protein
MTNVFIIQRGDPPERSGSVTSRPAHGGRATLTRAWQRPSGVYDGSAPDVKSGEIPVMIGESALTLKYEKRELRARNTNGHDFGIRQH